MATWENVDDLRSFLDTVLTYYPKPDEVYRYNLGDQSGDDLRVGKEDISDYKGLLKDTGTSVVEEALESNADYEYTAPTNTDLPHIPYIAILDPTESISTTYGRYVVYLFDLIEKAAYLTINIGAKRMAKDYSKRLRQSGTQAVEQSANDILQWLAHWYRTQCSPSAGFSAGPISITSHLNHSGPYSNGTIYYKKYSHDDLPTNEDLVNDVKAAVEIYSDLISDRVSNVGVELTDCRAWHVSTENKRWPGWRENGVASIGWELDPDKFDQDPTNLTNIDETTVTRSEGQGYAFQFEREISAGDLIVAAVRGKSNPHHINGIGRVTETNPDIDFSKLHESIQSDSHYVGVDWISFESAVPITLGRHVPLIDKTLTELTERDFEHVLGTTLVHAVAGGLFRSIDEAVASVQDTIGTTITVHEDASLKGLDDTEQKISQEDQESNDKRLEADTETWKLADIERATPHFSITADDISLSSRGLYFENEDELLERTLRALSNGNHLLFVGPPGTGKSKLARALASELIGEKHKMTTATADWSTFDTIGGYQQQQSGELAFESGLFLDRFQSNGQPINEWLIIDEFNRANIDKAFGPLFSVLAGDDVVLQFQRNGEDVTVYGSEPDPQTQLGTHEFVVPDDWRLLATMNTFDKSSLYDLSYALSRRFSYIHIPAPAPEEIDQRLVNRYVECWNDLTPSDDEIAAVADLWQAVQSERPLGPAIARDILAASGDDMTPGVLQHMLPQFEGMMNRSQQTVLERIAATGHVDTGELELFGHQYFELDELDL